MGLPRSSIPFACRPAEVGAGHSVRGRTAIVVDLFLSPIERARSSGTPSARGVDPASHQAPVALSESRRRLDIKV